MYLFVFTTIIQGETKVFKTLLRLKEFTIYEVGIRSWRGRHVELMTGRNGFVSWTGLKTFLFCIFRRR